VEQKETAEGQTTKHLLDHITNQACRAAKAAAATTTTTTTTTTSSSYYHHHHVAYILCMYTFTIICLSVDVAHYT